jgi:uncharacterized protein YecT (DUF1311 family)
MKKNILIIMLSLISFSSFASSDAIKKQLDACISQDDSASNPTVIACNNLALEQADKEINKQARIILEIMTGEDSQGRDLSLERPTFITEITSFFIYRDSAGSVAAALDGGTVSDMVLKSTKVKVELTLNELKSLEQIN